MKNIFFLLIISSLSNNSFADDPVILLPPKSKTMREGTRGSGECPGLYCPPTLNYKNKNSDNDPVIEHLRKKFKEAQVPQIEDLPARLTWCTSYYAFNGNYASGKKFEPILGSHQFEWNYGMVNDDYSMFAKSGHGLGKVQMTFVPLENHLIAEATFNHLVDGSLYTDVWHRAFIRVANDKSIIIEYAANPVSLKRQLDASGPISLSDSSLSATRYEFCPLESK